MNAPITTDTEPQGLTPPPLQLSPIVTPVANVADPVAGVEKKQNVLDWLTKVFPLLVAVATFGYAYADVLGKIAAVDTRAKSAEVQIEKLEQTITTQAEEITKLREAVARLDERTKKP